MNIWNISSENGNLKHFQKPLFFVVVFKSNFWTWTPFSVVIFFSTMSKEGESFDWNESVWNSFFCMKEYFMTIKGSRPNQNQFICLFFFSLDVELKLNHHAEVSVVLELKLNGEMYLFSSLMPFFLSHVFVTLFHALPKQCQCCW